jgi:YD repeat-containing protein
LLHAQNAHPNAGNRTAKTDRRAAVTSNYGYDAIYELTGVTQGTNTTESYTYDPVGNRLSSLGVSPYSINVSNELTSTPTPSYTYDSNGNMLTKTDRRERRAIRGTSKTA